MNPIQQLATHTTLSPRHLLRFDINNPDEIKLLSELARLPIMSAKTILLAVRRRRALATQLLASIGAKGEG